MPDNQAKDLLTDLATTDFDALSLTPERFRFRFESTRLEEDMNHLLVRLLPYLAPKAVKNETRTNIPDLPDAVKGNTFYEWFLRKAYWDWNPVNGKRRSPKDVIEKNRNQMRLASERPDEEKIYETIRSFAKNVEQCLEREAEIPESEEVSGASQVRDNIHRLLVRILRRNREEIASRKIFYCGDGEKNTFVSTKELKDAVRKTQNSVRDGNVSSENAAVAVLMTLKAITFKEVRRKCRPPNDGNGGNVEESDPILRLSDLDLSNLNEELEASLQWARGIARKDLELVNVEIGRACSEGEITEDFTRPKINERLRNDDIFSLLEKLFDASTTPRVANDAQILLNLALAHWTDQRYVKNKNWSARKVKEMDERILKCLFQTTDKDEFKTKEVRGPMLSYDREKKKFKAINGLNEKQTVFCVNGRFNIQGSVPHLYCYEMGRKETDPAVMKTFLRGELIPSKLTDRSRIKFVAWNISSKQMRGEENVRRSLHRMLEAVSKDLGLEEVVISEETGENRFFKWDLTARNRDGLPIELIIVPHEQFLFETADGSALGHYEYEKRRRFEFLRMAIPHSVSEVAHSTVSRKIAAMDQHMSETRAAIRDFIEKDEFKTLMPA